MAKVYADLIRKGLKTIEEVPERIRAEVQAILDADSNAQISIIFLQKGCERHGSDLCNFDC